jgi:hypothetical protein
MKKSISGSGLRKIENYYKRNNARQKIQAHRSVEQQAADIAARWNARIVTGNKPGR